MNFIHNIIRHKSVEQLQADAVRSTDFNRGSNEGGTGRQPTAEQPTGAPGTGDLSDPNRGAGVGDAGGSQGQSGDTAERAGQQGQSSGQSSDGSSSNR